MTAAPKGLLTPRLRLRPFMPEDLPIYAAMNRDPAVAEFLGGPMSAEDSDKLAMACNSWFASESLGMIAIERREDGAFLGSSGLNQLDWYPDDLEVGWRLAREHWGKGYATEAGAAWVAHAFEVHGRARVISVTDVPNLRSIAVMQRLGMRLDHYAELKDAGVTFAAVIHALRGADWAGPDRAFEPDQKGSARSA